ncbi:cytochrome c maturation protein CcmE [Desulfovibrio ferrophilus]|uniref:Cytochrome c-type biogenesis protein CcmE n=1 Tax=Desulfovibrio ferrophilus TaxID=241368 RepID=A0A2Z6AYV8_9BACT|nr:cytochrome c maturation protein CcmE [Desulfovibrio ferrophilus]BBD08373.1 cytochrome c-type biogenesis protein CcmE [Desulfovibrio ferrophilus]
MAKKNSKGIYVAALCLLLGGLGWLLFSGVTENSVYFVNVSEALTIEPSKLANARLFGSVDARDIQGGPGTMGVSFLLVDKDDTTKSMMVTYKGAVPDTFKAGVEVIVEGGLNPANGVFVAKTLMTKCPSKYQKIRDEEKADKG